MMKLEGRNILITGASRGIGRGCALELAKAGANIGINYRSHRDEAEEVAEQITKMGRKAVIVQADVSDQQSVEQMVKEVVSQLGELNGYVSNAAYF